VAEKNELQILITARDEASRQIAAATQNVRGELQTLERATQGVTKATQDSADAFRRSGETFEAYTQRLRASGMATRSGAAEFANLGVAQATTTQGTQALATQTLVLDRNLGQVARGVRSVVIPMAQELAPALGQTSSQMVQVLAGAALLGGGLGTVAIAAGGLASILGGQLLQGWNENAEAIKRFDLAMRSADPARMTRELDQLRAKSEDLRYQLEQMNKPGLLRGFRKGGIIGLRAGEFELEAELEGMAPRMRELERGRQPGQQPEVPGMTLAEFAAIREKQAQQEIQTQLSGRERGAALRRQQESLLDALLDPVTQTLVRMEREARTLEQPLQPADPSRPRVPAQPEAAARIRQAAPLLIQEATERAREMAYKREQDALESLLRVELRRADQQDDLSEFIRLHDRLAESLLAEAEAEERALRAAAARREQAIRAQFGVRPGAEPTGLAAEAIGRVRTELEGQLRPLGIRTEAAQESLRLSREAGERAIFERNLQTQFGPQAREEAAFAGEFQDFGARLRTGQREGAAQIQDRINAEERLARLQQESLGLTLREIELTAQLPGLTEDQRDALALSVSSQREMIGLRQLELEITQKQRELDAGVTEERRTQLELEIAILQQRQGVLVREERVGRSITEQSRLERTDITAGIEAGFRDIGELAGAEGARAREALLMSFDAVRHGLSDIIIAGLTGDSKRIGDIGKRIGETFLRAILDQVTTGLAANLFRSFQGALGSFGGGAGGAGRAAFAAVPTIASPFAAAGTGAGALPVALVSAAAGPGGQQVALAPGTPIAGIGGAGGGVGAAPGPVTGAVTAPAGFSSLSSYGQAIGTLASTPISSIFSQGVSGAMATTASAQTVLSGGQAISSAGELAATGVTAPGVYGQAATGLGSVTVGQAASMAVAGAAFGVSLYAASQTPYTGAASVTGSALSGAITGAALGYQVGSMFGYGGYGAAAGALVGAVAAAGLNFAGRGEARRLERRQQRAGEAQQLLQEIRAAIDGGVDLQDIAGVRLSSGNTVGGLLLHIAVHNIAGLYAAWSYVPFAWPPVQIARDFELALREIGVQPETMNWSHLNSPEEFMKNVAPERDDEGDPINLEQVGPIFEDLFRAMLSKRSRVLVGFDELLETGRRGSARGVTRTTLLALERLAEATGKDLFVIASTLSGLTEEQRQRVLDRIAANDLDGAIQIMATESDFGARLLLETYQRAAAGGDGAAGGATPGSPFPADTTQALLAAGYTPQQLAEMAAAGVTAAEAQGILARKGGRREPGPGREDPDLTGAQGQAVEDLVKTGLSFDEAKREVLTYDRGLRDLVEQYGADIGLGLDGPGPTAGTSNTGLSISGTGGLSFRVGETTVTVTARPPSGIAGKIAANAAKAAGVNQQAQNVIGQIADQLPGLLGGPIGMVANRVLGILQDLVTNQPPSFNPLPITVNITKNVVDVAPAAAPSGGGGLSEGGPSSTAPGVPTVSIEAVPADISTIGVAGPGVPSIDISQGIGLGLSVGGDTAGDEGAPGIGGAGEGFQRGGFVPGTSRGDTVPALLEPGEFVVPREAAQRLAPELEKIRAHAASSEVVVVGPTDQPIARQQRGTASVPGSGRGDIVPAMLEPQEAVIPREAAQQNRPLIEEIIETGRPVSLEKLQAVVVQVERRLREVEDTRTASPEEVTVAAAVAAPVEVPATEPGVYHDGGEVRAPAGATAPSYEVPATLLRGEWVIPQAPAQQNRTVLEEIQRFGRSVSLEKVQEAIVKHDQELRRITDELLALARDGVGEVSDPAEEARQYQQLRERLARDEGWLTQVLREFARLNQARDLGLLPVARGTVNF
jgi:hypothetical protein